MRLSWVQRAAGVTVLRCIVSFIDPNVPSWHLQGPICQYWLLSKDKILNCPSPKFCFKYVKERGALNLLKWTSELRMVGSRVLGSHHLPKVVEVEESCISASTTTAQRGWAGKPERSQERASAKSLIDASVGLSAVGVIWRWFWGSSEEVAELGLFWRSLTCQGWKKSNAKTATRTSWSWSLQIS